MSTPITEIELRERLTPADFFDAISAGIIPDGNYTVTNEELILQNRKIYEWLKSKDDPRFIGTTLEITPSPTSSVEESIPTPTNLLWWGN